MKNTNITSYISQRQHTKKNVTNKNVKTVYQHTRSDINISYHSNTIRS